MIRTFVLACVLSSFAPALQFDDEWVTFSRDDAIADLTATQISNPQTEVDFDWADLDQNGWTDLVVVRKQPASTSGRRTNLLFMNDSGVLTERSADYAAAADIVGDEGFLTATNDRDVVIVDVDNDGWLDLVTSTGVPTAGLAKSIGHPRVYMNLAEDGNGDWLGLKYEESRFPQLLSYTTGLPANPVFCSVSAGDVTDDGFADLYFTHYDFSNNGFTTGPDNDLDDRLLVNDGSGFFTDESQARMTAQMLFSRFGLSSAIVDINDDGYADILKDTALAAPYYVSASYNDPTSPGNFGLFDTFHSGFSPYHISVGDLNNDGRLDIVAGDDDPDRYRYNLGNDPLGRVVWGPAKVYDFLVGNDDGFAGQNLIADLDGDGWADVLQCDVDTDEPGLNRRLHIYHNPGGVVGEQIDLREERELAGAGGWLGAGGFLEDDLKGTYDVAAFDIDGDTDLDVVLGRGAGTYFWINQGETAWQDVGFAKTGSAGDPLLVGSGDLTAGSANAVDLTSAHPDSTAHLVFGLGELNAPFKQGTLVPLPSVIVPLPTTGAGAVGVPFVLPSATPPGVTLVFQFWIVDPTASAGLSASNGVIGTTS